MNERVEQICNRYGIEEEGIVKGSLGKHPLTVTY